MCAGGIFLHGTINCTDLPKYINAIEENEDGIIVLKLTGMSRTSYLMHFIATLNVHLYTLDASGT